MRRTLDIVLSLACLVLLSPLMALTALGVRLASPGPVLYRAERVGRHARPFAMLKFRSMHVNAGGAAITSGRDPRIFRFGALIRLTKLDELPQLLNVLKGDMAVVGPRPEDPAIVATAYEGWMRETLDVRPGITSPGSLFYYAYGEALIDPADPEGSYIRHLLPPKLAIDRAYMERATVVSDAVCILRTAAAVAARICGGRIGPSACDLGAARRWADPARYVEVA